MREIKFRIWDVEAKRIQWPTSIPNKIGGSYDNDPIHSTYEDGVNTFYETCPPNPEIINGEKRNGIEEYILMQYTGLKDKNGKEIFEGDILEHSEHGYIERFEVCYGLGNYDSGVYKFIGFYLKKTNGDDDGYAGYMFDTDYIKVIGNIYENSNLLDNQEGK